MILFYSYANYISQTSQMGMLTFDV